MEAIHRGVSGIPFHRQKDETFFENRIRDFPRSKDSIRVEISDNGVGVEESAMEDIWKPFYTSKTNHFGLGLTYASMAATMLGTRLDVRSLPEKGTSVSLVIHPKGGQIEAT
jgi:C4-dicarboxylate-specific signal transduction histidine kinase